MKFNGDRTKEREGWDEVRGTSCGGGILYSDPVGVKNPMQQCVLYKKHA